MTKAALVLAAVLSACGAPGPRAPTSDELRGAVSRSVVALQASGETWLTARECASCHHQVLGPFAVAEARDRGIAIDAAALARQRERLREALAGRRPGIVSGDATIVLIRSYGVVGLGTLAGYGIGSVDEVAAIGARMIRRRPARDGSWRPTFVRPPIEGSLFGVTALSLRALSLAGIPADRERIARARAWLQRHAPENTDDRAWQLFGLAWAGAEPSVLAASARTILAAQREDGGWAQFAGGHDGWRATAPAVSTSDPYATGETVTALVLTGQLAPSDAAYVRAVHYLLSTQLPDGTWHVATRRRAIGIPAFETGFPYGEDQFVSYAASAWATLALTFGLGPARPSPIGTRAEPPGVALAPADDLFAASDDLAAVQRLLAAGADPNARSKTETTPLMAAASGNGPIEVLDALLGKGADVNAMKSDGTTALALACSYGGDLAKVRRLLAAGADPNRGVALGPHPLSYAVRAHDPELVALLLHAGAKPDAADLDVNDEPVEGLPPLAYAAEAGYADLVELLLAHGADPNARDTRGKTPLMWAAMVDTSDDRIGRALLSHGASPALRTPSGDTAASLAAAHGRSLP